MRCHLLVLSESGAEGSPDLLQCLPTCRWRHEPWDAFSPESLLKSPPGLLILSGVPNPVRALECLAWLKGRAIRSTLLALLPRHIDEESLALAAAVADDFVLWPERAMLVRQRIARLLPAAAEEADQAYERLMRELGQANLIGRDPAFLRSVERVTLSATRAFRF